MNTQLIRSFAILFGAVIALICAVYILVESRKKPEPIQQQEQKPVQEQELEIN